jgi:hypothetical protein
MRRALIVVGKAAAAGSAKTRLAPPLTEQEAADLYRGFLLDTLELAASLDWEGTTLVHPRGDAPLLAPLVGEMAVQLLEQRSAGLGDALASAFEHHFAAGFDVAVLIGSDNPTLSAGPVREACDALRDGADLSLGPSVDGGYYLIGMRRPQLGVFEQIEWSTPRVYAQTLARASALGLRVHQVAEWYDVDAPEDLRRLVDELGTGPPTLARHTRAALEGLRGVNLRCGGASRMASGC